MKKWAVGAAILTLVLAACGARAADYSSNNFTVKDPLLRPLGGLSSSGSYSVYGSLSQEVAGISSSGSYGVDAGFIFYAPPAASTSTPPSVVTSYISGSFTVPSKVSGACDFDSDGKCGIDDLSIMLYYFGKSGDAVKKYDLNHDGKIDILDFSILFYYWTA